MPPDKVAGDEARDGGGATLDETKKEEELDPALVGFADGFHIHFIPVAKCCLVVVVGFDEWCSIPHRNGGSVVKHLYKQQRSGKDRDYEKKGKHALF